MAVFDIIRQRRSIRKYKNRPIEKEKIEKMLEAARIGPSAANMQPCTFVVVLNQDVRQKLRRAYNNEWFVNAPVIIVACASPSDAWRRDDGEEYWKVDAAIAMQNLILEATELGLGTCWIADFDEKEAKRALEIPKYIRVVAMTPLGYPDEQKEPTTDRKPLTAIIHYEKW